MELASRYSAEEIEDKWYQFWDDQGYFHSEVNDQEPYSIVIPPPNVTGVLHMGHMLNNTVQDILIRRARLLGKNACWVPGTDHASIATEAKVVRWLREEKGLTKSEIGREKYLEYAWEWTDKYGGIILKQLRKLGASCDWKRTAFTMDEDRSEQVIQVFVDLYKKGKIYRGLRMVNWDIQAKTVLSNEEVLYEEEQTQLWSVRYPLTNGNGDIIVATTRPETIFGDTAIAVHPKDPRYQSLHGQTVVVPIANREIEIIADPYVDREFGTGALKITPAHDPNDYEIGTSHQLEIIDVLNNDGTMNEHAAPIQGLSREAGRKKMVQLLEEGGFLVDTQDYTHNVGRSERTKVVVEPRLSKQWYVDMKALAEPALQNVLNDNIEFFPKKYKNIYRHWLENIRDWCISRQLWWGHQVPAYYHGDYVAVELSPEAALKSLQEQSGNNDLSMSDIRQDDDVLDTWFSSWLWPFSVFNGLHPNRDVNYYYPTSVLVTGWDIIFLWVARMIMSGYEWKNEMPFKHVYFTGMVRDKQRRKMSKSLGNSPDPLQLIENYSADGVRFGMLASSPAGGDLLFDEKLCEQGRNFTNKIWNALRLLKYLEKDATMSALSPVEDISLSWLESKFNKVLSEINQMFDAYKLSDALIQVYTFIWTDFCSGYLEMIKPASGKTASKAMIDKTYILLEKMMIVLHPFMPFITEEVWHQIKPREQGDDCIVSQWPSVDTIKQDDIKTVDHILAVVNKVRDVRNQYGLKQKELIHMIAHVSPLTQAVVEHDNSHQLLKKMAVLSEIELIDGQLDSNEYASFVIGAEQYFIHVGDTRDIAAEIEKLTDELQYQEGFVKSVEKKLSNERFVQNAPESVVEKERQKLADGIKRIQLIKKNLEQLKK